MQADSTGIEIVEGVILLRGLPGVLLKRTSTVVIADLHLGYEESMARQGVFLPRLQGSKAVRIVRRIRELTGAKRLVINGDIKHEFGRLLRSEKLEVARLIKAAFDSGFREVVLVRGNHDNYIRPVVEALGGTVTEDLEEDGILVTHGHKRIGEHPGTVLIGHEHPSISLQVSGMKARYPVFLLVPLEEGEGVVVVLPAVGAYQTGNPVGLDRRRYLSPIIREKGVVDRAVPVIVDEKEGLMPLPNLSLLSELF